jgi:hypothetical protein
VSAPHVCAIAGCGLELPLDRLMCRPHWYRVPAELRTEVWSAWRRFQAGRLSIGELRAVQDRAAAAVASS